MTLRAAIYARRSTDEHQAASLDVQIGEAKRYIQTKGWTLDEGHIFIDDAVSRAEFKKRPGLFKMLNAAEDRAFDVVVVRDESRLGGDMVRTSLLISDILDAGVQLFYYVFDEEVRLDDATAKFMVAARNFASELEREKIASRTREHLLTKARKAYNVGGKVFGYRNVEITEGERRVRVEYQIDEKEAEIVRYIFTKYSEGLGLKAIAKDLNAKKIPSPRAGSRGTGSWAPSAIHAMLRRERYIGKIVWGKTAKTYRKGTKVRNNTDTSEWVAVDAPHLRIVSDELWFAVQARIASHASAPHSQSRGRTPKYLLSTLARCAACGGPITVANGRSGKDPIKVYVCSYHRTRGDEVCKTKLRRPVHDVDDAILDYIASRVLHEDRISQAIRHVEKRLLDRLRSTSAGIKELEKEAAQLRVEIDRLVHAIASTDSAPAPLVQAIATKQERLAELDGQIRAAKAAPEAIRTELRAIEAEIRNVASEFTITAKKEPEKARLLLHRLVGGRLLFEPTPLRRFKVRGQVSFRNLASMFTKVASPAGFEPALQP